MAITLEGKPWTFQQLTGEKRVLVLSGWGAPFGGPRTAPVVRTPVRARTERVFYPGGSTSTRHIFGLHHPNWELTGRFMDRAGGRGFAKAKVAEVQTMVEELQEVRVSWGDILFAEKAFLIEFDPGWEGERDVEWKLTLEVDARERQKDSYLTIVSAKPPGGYTDQILRSLEVVEPVWGRPALPGDLVATIDTLVSSLTGAVGSVIAAAEQIQSFKDATFAQLNRLHASLATLGSAARVLRETFVSIPVDALTLQDNADASIELMTSQTTVDEQLLAIRDEATRMDRAVAIAKYGRVQGSVVARTGDTWEGISSQAFGRPDRAGDVRDLNAIAPGANPIVGVEYLLPF